MCDSFEKVEIITPSDSGLFVPPLNGISIGTAGILRILDGQQNDVTIPANSLAVGVIHRMKIQRVFSTTTAATELIGYT